MNTYAVGDIHGRLDLLERLIRRLEPELDLDDRLVFVGDYVDRGPDSKGVIDFLLNLQTQRDCVFLKGNHEDMMLETLGGRFTSTGQRMSFPAAMRYQPHIWMYNGAIATAESYGRDFSNLRADDLPEAHLEFLRQLKMYHIQDDLAFVHAGVSFKGLLATTAEGAVMATSDEDLLWTRETRKRPNNFGTVIYGHSPYKNGVHWHYRPEEGKPPFSVGIDVGAVFDCNPLTAVRVEDWTEWF